MPSRSWSEEHSRAVADSAPPVDPVSQQQLDRVWAQVQAGLGDDGRRPRRRRLRIVAGAGVAAVLLGAGGVAGAAVYSAHTGQGPVDAEDARLGGPGERLDPAAPDYPQVLTQIVQDVPFPTDQDRRSFVAAEVAGDRKGAIPGEASVSTGALHYWGARSAVCAWSDQWAASVQSGDVSAKAEAITMLEQAPSWPAVTAIDPRPSAAEDTPASYFVALREAARSDDLARAAVVLARSGACDAYGADMPHLPRANHLGDVGKQP